MNDTAHEDFKTALEDLIATARAPFQPNRCRRPWRPFAPGRVHHIGGGIRRHGSHDGERDAAHRHERAVRLHPDRERDRRLSGGDPSLIGRGFQAFRE